jgi:hypothetical protein
LTVDSLSIGVVRCIAAPIVLMVPWRRGHCVHAVCARHELAPRLQHDFTGQRR